MEKVKEVYDDYSKWKRKNVTYRGMKDICNDNNVYGSLGKGLYTTPGSNKSMTRTYGKMYYVINARPENPLKFNTWNDWELWFQNLCYKKLGLDSIDNFHKKYTIEGEVQKLGYDGIEIIGREMVNYTPDGVEYFETERGLESYYQDHKTLESLPMFEDFKVEMSQAFKPFTDKIKDIMENGVVKNVAAMVYNPDGKVLMGTSTADDDRDGLLCFPGGSIKDGESILHGAKREAKEETGLNVECEGSVKIVGDTAFVKCLFDPKKGRPIDNRMKPNHEFIDMGWYDINNLPDDVYKPNVELLESFMDLFKDSIQKETVKKIVDIAKDFAAEDEIEHLINYTYRSKDHVVSTLKNFMNSDNYSKFQQKITSNIL